MEPTGDITCLSELNPAPRLRGWWVARFCPAHARAPASRLSREALGAGCRSARRVASLALRNSGPHGKYKPSSILESQGLFMGLAEGWVCTRGPLGFRG